MFIVKLVYKYYESQKNELEWNNYLAHFEKYKRYKQTGDVKELN